MAADVVLESRCTNVRGWPMHYVASIVPVDPRPPVVLVHGVGLSHRYLLPAAVHLARDFRVYLPDLPGFGFSYKPSRALAIPELADWLAAWIEAVGIRPAALVANSVGCQVIADLAARYPGHVSRAVLQGPTCDPQARHLLQQIFRWSRNRMRETLSTLEPIPIRVGKGPGATIRWVPPATTQDYKDCGYWRVYQTFQYAMEHRIEDRLLKVECPTLVVRGLQDPIVPQRWAEEATRRLRHGRLIVLPGVPHTANLVAPLELYRVVKPFLLEERQPRPAQHRAARRQARV